jgi:lipoprotein-releasing system permease protein
LQVRDWTQENEAYFRAIRIEKTMMGLILMLIVAVAVFNIVATLIMVVNDKRTDIAILRTLGLSPRGVLAVFMTQGLLIGWIGAAGGVALGLSRSRSTSTSSCPSSRTRSIFTSWTRTCTTSRDCRAKCMRGTW